MPLPIPLRPPPPVGWPAWLHDVFERLLQHFGPRGWWPAATPFEMIAGAILTQNMAWSGAARAVANLEQAGLLTPAALHAAAAEQVAALIRPAGYFRTKAQKLKAFAAHVVTAYDGSLTALLRRPLAELRPELLSLYGIGPETADCILCYAAGYPVMPMDAYTGRIMARLGVAPPRADYHRLQRFFHDHLPRDTALFNEYHALLDALGHAVCRKRSPRCDVCPLADLCPAAGTDARQ